MLDKKTVFFALWASIALLLFAPLSSWLYGYYTLLRWAVCLTTGYLTYENYSKGHKGFSCIFGAIALLFNPLTPIHLSRAGWGPIDWIVAGFLCFYVARGRLIRLKVEKKLLRKLLLWGGVSVCGLFLLGVVWSRHEYETHDHPISYDAHDYPISLVLSRTRFQPEESLKSIKGELIIHGWNLKPVSGSPDTWLVSFTYDTSARSVSPPSEWVPVDSSKRFDVASSVPVTLSDLEPVDLSDLPSLPICMRHWCSGV